LNNNPSAVFFISKSWLHGVYDTAHVGIWYDQANSKWSVYNENWTNSLEINSAYNIFVPDAATSFYKHVATDNFYVTYLDNPMLNNNPDARIFVVHDYTNTPATEGYVNDEIGVWYDGSNWTIYTENPADTLFTGATFNVLILRNDPLGTADLKNEKSNIKVTPNPANDHFVVLLNSTSLKSLKEIRMSSMDGQTVFTKSYNGGEGQTLLFNISVVPAGLYVLTAVTGEGILTTKVNVVR
jgi:hypothetical protein